MFKKKAQIAWLVVGLIFDVRWIEGVRLVMLEVRWPHVWMLMLGSAAAMWAMMGLSRLMRMFVEIQESESLWSSRRSLFHENSLAFYTGAMAHYMVTLMVGQDAGSLVLAWLCGMLALMGWRRRRVEIAIAPGGNVQD